MKFLVFLFFVIGCTLAIPRTRRDVAADQSAVIDEQNLDISPDGAFQYNYKTSNSISARALGTPKDLGGNPPEVAEVIQGTFTWQAPDGKIVNVEYTADETGYHPKVKL